MYYKEQLINGIWHYKLTPNGEWKPFSTEQLNNKITELKANIESINFEDFKKNILCAISDYMYSEGCSCCRDIEKHEINTKRIAELLNVSPYSDNSGYDFSPYRTTS